MISKMQASHRPALFLRAKSKTLRSSRTTSIPSGIRIDKMAESDGGFPSLTERSAMNAIYKVMKAATRVRTICVNQMEMGRVTFFSMRVCRGCYNTPL